MLRLLRLARPDRADAPSHDLAIFEDDRAAPVPFFRSPFRVAEYATYLRHFPGSALYSTYLGAPKGAAAPFDGSHKDLAGRALPLGGADQPLPRCRLAYTVFLNNAFAFVKGFEEARVPFCFTLYPGGGFSRHDPYTDAKLRRVLSSPCFRKVIVTQELTRRYLLDNRFCPARRVELIYGGVFPLDDLATPGAGKRRYRVDKETFDVAFVAFRYSPRGEDKGYDVFLDCARRVAAEAPDARFHVVGNFDPDTIPVGPLADRVRFHGPRPTTFFPEFYRSTDVILSPNVPSVLAPGAFDGFPTGCCIEAGSCGVAVVCTDPLGMNHAFADGEELAIVPHDARAMGDVLLGYYRDTEALYRLAERGRRAFREVFGAGRQLGPRLRLLTACLEGKGPVDYLAGVRPRALAARLFRRRPHPLALTPAEVRAAYRRSPDDAFLLAAGISYDLLLVQDDGTLVLHAPPPGPVPTRACLNLGGHRARTFEMEVVPAPRGEHGPYPIHLSVVAHSGPDAAGRELGACEAILGESGAGVPLTLAARGPGAIRSLTFTARMAPGAPHNWCARVYCRGLCVGAE